MADINIEIVFMHPENAYFQSFRLPENTTLLQAILQSEIHDVAQSSIQAGLYGIWGNVCSGDTLLQDGDRVEIYRPLIIDPKTLRRQRSKQRNNHE